MIDRSLSRRSVAALGTMAAVGALLPRSSAALEPPTGTPLLTVTGRVGVTNGAAGALFDRAMLDGLPTGRFVTATTWDPEVRTFTGPWIRDLLTALRANGRSMKITALNDYSVTMPVAADQPFQPILASRIDGQPIPVRNKGPLWVMYDFGSDPALRTDLYQARAIWGVKSIEVLD
jgi:hypothetical protein